MAFTKIKFQVLQIKIQHAKPSDQEVILLILTMTLFMILLHFVMIGQPQDFIDRFFFKIFHHFLLVYFYCYLDFCYSISSLISSLHIWSIIFWCVTTQRKQISTFGFVKVLKPDLYKSIGIALFCRILIKIASVIFVAMCHIILQKYWVIFYSTLYHLSQPILQPK